MLCPTNMLENHPFNRIRSSRPSVSEAATDAQCAADLTTFTLDHGANSEPSSPAEVRFQEYRCFVWSRTCATIFDCLVYRGANREHCSCFRYLDVLPWVLTSASRDILPGILLSQCDLFILATSQPTVWAASGDQQFQENYPP